MLTDHLPRTSLAFLPTPVHEMERLRERLGPSCPRLLIKRDDQTGLATGGNKTRKLEFVLADAIAQGSDVLITAGGPQSNHCRQTAAAAARLGLGCVLIASGERQPKKTWNGNLLLNHLLGASVVFARHHSREEMMQSIADDLKSKGRTPYVIPVGASMPIGSAGYVAAVEELAGQLDEMGEMPDTVIFASGSAGTHAGILVGSEALGLPFAVEGIADGDDVEELRAKICDLVKETTALLKLDLQIPDEKLVLHGSYGEPGYAVITDGDVRAMELMAQSEGILADPVYTGRALKGVFGLIEQGRWGVDETVMFWHTGGSSGMFGRADEIMASLP